MLSDVLVLCSLSLGQASGSRLKHIDHFEGGTHNGTWTCYGYYDCINRFLAPVSLHHTTQPSHYTSQHTSYYISQHTSQHTS